MSTTFLIILQANVALTIRSRARGTDMRHLSGSDQVMLAGCIKNS